MSSEIEILQLPPEILTEIFLYLELPDRKNVRSSCKSFYDACNRIPIISKEKLVLRGCYCIQDITKTLLLCQYLKLNLEFQGLLLFTLREEIWIRCGATIHSLTIHHCSVGEKVLKNVIIHCRNLKHLEMRWHVCDSLNSMLSGLESMKPFEELIKENVIHNKLETFMVHIDNKSIWASIIEKIFVIFPNLKTFGALYCCSKDHIRDDPQLDSTRPVIFTSTPVDKCQIFANVERLLIDLPSDGPWLKNPFVWNLRLKEIQTSLYHVNKILETLFDFFSYQKLLEVICLTVHDICDKLFKRLLFHIVKVCPNLRRLSLNYPTTYIIELSEYEFNLLNKRLEFLKLRFNFNDSLPDQIMTTVKPSINRNLHTLIIDSYESSANNYVYVRMLEYFQNLNHLSLYFPTDEVVQAIIKYQESLEVLRLNYVDECSDYGFTGRRGDEDPSQPIYSMRRLKNLQRLDFNCYGCGKFTPVSFLEFVFPQLKIFRCDTLFNDDTYQEFIRNLKTMAENVPQLEIVIINLQEIEFLEFLEFPFNLKKLYHFECLEQGHLSSSDRLKLFRGCPSLRFLVLLDYKQILYRNPFTEKITIRPLDDMHFEWSVDFPWPFHI